MGDYAEPLQGKYTLYVQREINFLKHQV